MRDPQIEHPFDPPGAVRAGGSGIGEGPADPRDRSYLLRRETRFPFPTLNSDAEVRLRRSRRVFASFSAIRPLSRNGRS